MYGSPVYFRFSCHLSFCRNSGFGTKYHNFSLSKYTALFPQARPSLFHFPSSCLDFALASLLVLYLFRIIINRISKQKAGRITASSGLLRKPYVCSRVRPLPDKSAGKIMDILSSLPLPACFVMLSATPDSRLTYFCYIS